MINESSDDLIGLQLLNTIADMITDKTQMLQDAISTIQVSIE